jgi:hypothetical protein
LEVAEYIPAQTKVRTAITPEVTAVAVPFRVSPHAMAPIASVATIVGMMANFTLGYLDRFMEWSGVQSVFSLVANCFSPFQ